MINYKKIVSSALMGIGIYLIGIVTIPKLTPQGPTKAPKNLDFKLISLEPAGGDGIYKFDMPGTQGYIIYFKSAKGVAAIYIPREVTWITK